MGSCSKYEQQYKHQSAFSQQWILQQTAERLTLADEQSDRRQSQQYISGVSHTYAHWVIVNAKPTARTVIIVRRLIQAVAIYRKHTVHGNIGRDRMSTLHIRHRTDIIGRSIRARIILDIETIQTKDERKRDLLLVRLTDEGCHFSPLL